MKTNVLLVVGVVFCAILFVQGKRAEKYELPKAIRLDSTAVKYSGNIKTIIDNKCYGCHNNQSRGVKARIKLNFDSLALVTKVNQLSTLDKIVEVLDKGEMPPKQFLERKPEGKMTDEETVALKGWAQKASDALLK